MSHFRSINGEWRKLKKSEIHVNSFSDIHVVLNKGRYLNYNVCTYKNLFRLHFREIVTVSLFVKQRSEL